jgi:hypothetical protein
MTLGLGTVPIGEFQIRSLVELLNSGDWRRLIRLNCKIFSKRRKSAFEAKLRARENVNWQAHSQMPSLPERRVDVRYGLFFVISLQFFVPNVRCLHRSQFEPSFLFGTSTSSYQVPFSSDFPFSFFSKVLRRKDVLRY